MFLSEESESMSNQEELIEFVENISDKEWQVLESHFGIKKSDSKEAVFEQVINLRREQIKEIEQRALSRLRQRDNPDNEG